MKRSLLLSGVLLLPALALAQVNTPASPTATRGSTTLSAPPPPQPVPPTRPISPAVPAPVQGPRPVASPPAGPIRSTGPAQALPPPRTTAPAKVYDREGRIIPGVQQAGPNRVFDSRTGRYHDSVPQGADSRINP